MTRWADDMDRAGIGTDYDTNLRPLSRRAIDLERAYDAERDPKPETRWSRRQVDMLDVTTEVSTAAVKPRPTRRWLRLPWRQR